MPRVRINLRDLEELDDDLEELHDLEERSGQEDRIRVRGRADIRKSLEGEARYRKMDERRKSREFARLQRRRNQE